MLSRAIFGTTSSILQFNAPFESILVRSGQTYKCLCMRSSKAYQVPAIEEQHCYLLALDPSTRWPALDHACLLPPRLLIY